MWQMLLADSISRFTTYYSRHGAKATVERCRLSLRRWILANRHVVFYWDLTQPTDAITMSELPDHLTVERKDRREQIDSTDWHVLVNYWNPKLSSRTFEERLRRGASIWLLRSRGHLAAYVWSVTGGTLESYYYPVPSCDGYLYDFLVFPEYRGQQLNSWLVTYVLRHMAAASISRAHVDIAEWNRASLSSTAKVGYTRVRVGVARKWTVFGNAFVEWDHTNWQSGASVAAPEFGTSLHECDSRNK